MDLFNVLVEIYLGYNIFLCEDSGMRYCTFHGIIPEKNGIFRIPPFAHTFPDVSGRRSSVNSVTTVSSPPIAS